MTAEDPSNPASGGGAPPPPDGPAAAGRSGAGAGHPDAALLRMALARVREGVVLADAQGIIEFINPAAARLCGWSPARARGRHVAEVVALIDEQTRASLRDALLGSLRGARPWRAGDRALLVQQGTQAELSVELESAPLPHRPGRAAGLILSFRDVTEYRRLGRLVDFQATHDALTGLLNRREFEARLRALLERSRPGRRRHALACIDLDQFGLINDAGGHAAGDALLREVAQRLQSRVRRSDTLARIEGDRFAVLLAGCPVERALPAVEGLRESVRGLHFPWRDRIYEVSASVGLVPVEEGADSVLDLLGMAGSACEVARERGRDRVQVYEPDDAAVIRQQNLSGWMRRVQDALEHGHFRLLVQDIVPVHATGGTARHGELLLRMRESDGGLIAPDTFLAAAERYNLMPAIDRWVVREATSMIAAGTAGLADLDLCAINLSGQSLSAPEFLAFVAGCLTESGVDPRRICFEITETAVIADPANARRFISVLRGTGCRFALDDFGSGASSFGYLRDLTVDYLKIDGSFVRGMADDAVDRAMVESINQIGHILGLRTVAEYVQHQKTLEILRQIGVDFAQGSAVAEPRPVG